MMNCSYHKKLFLCRPVLLIFLFSLILLPVMAGGDDEISLREKLEGLNPRARIAYLRYLLREEGADPEVYFQMGVHFQEVSVNDSALYYYRRCIEADSLFFKAYVNMGVLYDQEGRVGKAVEMYQQALGIDQNDVLALSHAAFLHFRLKNYSTSSNYINRALELDPNSAQAHFYLAVMFWENRIYREAFREWSKVIELAPQSFLADRARENITILQSVFNPREIQRPGKSKR